MKKKLLQKLLLPIGGVLLLVVGWYFYQTWTDQKQDVLELHGNVDIRQVNLGFRVSGRILRHRSFY
jgi:HlyD family secretion protein